MVKYIEKIEDFAGLIFNLLKSDRDVNIAVGGFTGEGKSTFATQLCKNYAKKAETYWGFDRMTWSRKEVMTWINGDKKGDGQLDEYSIILPDELFSMFYRRNWYDEEQIDGIATFNMCRDRHIMLCGNVPNFWDLDSAFTSRIRFYVYIPKRGIAWVFQQENNPFSNDNWNVQENKKLFRKHNNPFKCKNFVCEIHYNDWNSSEKAKYYKIRNSKRLKAIDQNKSEKQERYSAIKKQRDDLIKITKKPIKKGLSNKEVSDIIGMSREAVRLIREGLR